MAPMKAVKKSAMKKPSAKAGSSSTGSNVVKRPATKALDSHVILTEAAIAKLEGASDDKIEEFLVKLSDKEQMSLWKKFEHQRKQDGTDDQYRKAVSGCGMKKKANHCLKVYLKTGGNTKDVLFQDLVTKVYSSTALQEKNTWQPLNYMLQRYGMKELKARVLAGTIDCRPNPHDPRFPEFKELLESSSRNITQENTTQVKGTRKATSQEFFALANMKLDGMQSIDFASEAEVPDTTESLMKSFLGRNNSSPLPSLPTSGKQPKFDADDEGQDQFFKDLETASAVEDATPMSVATLKLLQLKTIFAAMEDELAELGKMKPQHKEAVKKYKSEIKDQCQKIASCEKQLKAKSIKAGVMKKVVVLAAGIAKKTKQWMLKVG
jgi:hypothetical protein